MFVPVLALAGSLGHGSGVELPPESRVLEVFDGAENEHLGIGLAALGDVDGDGVGDLVLGSMAGAYTFCFGPGHVRAVSGRTGAELYRVGGTSCELEDSGDAFGDTIAALDDLDGDGACDFGVFAWRFEDYRGYVALRSGCDGSPIATLYGPPAIDDEPEVRWHEGPREPRVADPDRADQDHRFGTSGFGAFGHEILSLRGANGSVEGVSVSGFEFSGSDLHYVRRGPSAPWCFTGDLDGDGSPDLLEQPAYGRHRELLAVIGSLDGRELAALPIPKVPCIDREAAQPVGDVDGDGFVDLVILTRELDRPGALDPWVRVIRRARVGSGRDASPLLEWTFDHPDLQGVAMPIGVGDLDGDGKSEIWSAFWLTGGRTIVELRSGADAHVLFELRGPDPSFGSCVVDAGDLDGDGRPELAFGHYESQLAGRCTGRVYVISLRR